MHAPGSPKALERIPPARGPGQGPNPESSPEGSLGGAADAHRGSIEHVRRVLSTGDAGLTCQQPAERRGGSAGQHRNSPRPGRADDESGLKQSRIHQDSPGVAVRTAKAEERSEVKMMQVLLEYMPT